MAKIFKHADAPDGELRVSVGPHSFSLKGKAKYETDEPAIIDAAESHPFLDVDYSVDSAKVEKAAEAQAKEVVELQEAREAAHTQHAEKDQHEAAVEVPQTVADLKEKK